jgi:hypothetical protein
MSSLFIPHYTLHFRIGCSVNLSHNSKAIFGFQLLEEEETENGPPSVHPEYPTLYAAPRSGYGEVSRCSLSFIWERKTRLFDLAVHQPNNMARPARRIRRVRKRTNAFPAAPYKQRRNELFRIGVVKKNHLPSIKNNINEVLVRWKL